MNFAANPALLDAWIGKMQSEIGVLSTNLMQRDLYIEALERKCGEDNALIEALKARALAAEEANNELKATIRADRKSKA